MYYRRRTDSGKGFVRLFAEQYAVEIWEETGIGNEGDFRTGEVRGDVRK